MNRYVKLALLCLSLASVPLIMAPRNGSGTYSLPAGNPVVSGTTISSTVHNNTMSDIATALTGSLAKDGQTTPTANLPMGGFRHTGVGNPTLRNQYATVEQVQDGAYLLVGSVTGTDTIAGSLSPAISSYTAGMQVVLIPANANTGAATLNLNSAGALDVQKYTSAGQVALAANDLRAGIPALLILDTAGDDWILLNPLSGSIGDITVGTLTVTTVNASGTITGGALTTAGTVTGATLVGAYDAAGLTGSIADARLSTNVRTKANNGISAFGFVTGGTNVLSRSLNVTSVSRSSVGNYTLNVTAAGFSSTPICNATVATDTGGGAEIVATPTSATSITIKIQTPGGGGLDTDFSFECRGT